MTTDQTLLPCPFCGGEPEYDSYGEPGDMTFYIKCSNKECKARCGARFDEGDEYNDPKDIKTIEELYCVWNTRATVPAPIPGAQEAMDWIEDKIKYLRSCTNGDEKWTKEMADQVTICETIKAALIAAGAREK